jgi:2-methylcitrate dehydratase PrpD
LRLDASRIQEALGLAGTQTSVPSVWGAAGWIKDGVAWPAFTGVLAAFLADAGFKGPSRIFDGRRSYFVMAGSDRYESETLVADLGERWSLLELSFKPYPACRWIHAILDALVMIRDREGLRPDDVQEVIVTGTWELERIFARYEPMDLVDAQFSLPYLCALILHRVAPGTDWFDAELLTNREVLALARRVKIKTDPSAEIARQSNPNEMNATLSIILTDSRHLTMKCLRARGGPSAPLSDAELDVKFLQLTRSILGGQKASTALDMIHHIDDIDDVGDLLNTLIPEHMSME